ncbi:hypothetical protein CC80DRAFT_210088 [Byssothecium circinans]|uniref:Uncharacterized protein n=1 Tax=Byssothecium circinans TaxID=147558 RepID=A0A6A5TFI2_9PLEO|nr:hypothetical protein CC80DRAFT_210088 [Byssothecium circinans]
MTVSLLRYPIPNVLKTPRLVPTLHQSLLRGYRLNSHDLAHHSPLPISNGKRAYIHSTLSTMSSYFPPPQSHSLGIPRPRPQPHEPQPTIHVHMHTTRTQYMTHTCATPSFQSFDDVVPQYHHPSKSPFANDKTATLQIPWYLCTYTARAEMSLRFAPLPRYVSTDTKWQDLQFAYLTTASCREVYRA